MPEILADDLFGQHRGTLVDTNRVYYTINDSAVVSAVIRDV